MNLKYLLAGAALAATVCLTNAALAGAEDYAFEPVKTALTKGDDVALAVRLVHKPDGKFVSNAVIIRTRLDMAPEGMAEMATSVTAMRATEPGTYAFKADLSMEGRWLFSLAAKVQGEPETVVGKVMLKVTK